MPNDADLNRNSSPFPGKAGVRIGHVNLKVSDIERALAFYENVLGLQVTKRIGNAAAFLAFDSYHHDICINTWESRGGSPPAPGTTGLYHFAILYPTLAELAHAVLRLRAAEVQVDSAVDHTVSLSLYLRDPDGNGVELYWDRNPDCWHGSAGELLMGHRQISVDDILRAADEAK